MRILDNDTPAYPQHADLRIKVYIIDRDAERKSNPLTVN